jgi:hypothetical protein
LKTSTRWCEQFSMMDHSSLPIGRIDKKEPQGNAAIDSGMRTRTRTRMKTQEGTTVPNTHECKNPTPTDVTQGNDPRKKMSHVTTPMVLR